MKKSAMTIDRVTEHGREPVTEPGAASNRARARARDFEGQHHPRKLADVEVQFTYYAQSVLGPLDVLNAVAQHLDGVWGREPPRRVLAETAKEMMSVQFCSLHQVAFGGRFWIHSRVEESGQVRAVVCRADETGVAAEEELDLAERSVENDLEDSEEETVTGETNRIRFKEAN